MNINASTGLNEIAILACGDIPLEEFLGRLDCFNQSQLQHLTSVYGSERHAKAVLLKLSNIAVAKYQYHHRHTHLIARPFGLVIDPCNSCQLSCPGCIHREGGGSDIDWPSGNLKPETLDTLLENYGAYAISTRYFNWGEPLLNKQTPKYVAASRKFLMRTSISSNVSLPFDAEALVASGLDYLIMSIDGATQETYQKYRKRGDLGLVLENVRKLVAAKKKLDSYTPYLVWQYLLFDHTLPEIDMALQMAKDLGVNEINFTNAYDVSAFDPAITKPASPPMKQHILHFDGRAVMQSARSSASDLDERIETAWDVGWSGRYIDQHHLPQGQTCQWLYNDMVMDALGRVFPCCYVPKKQTIYGKLKDGVDLFNTRDFKFSREYFSDPSRFKQKNGGYTRIRDGERFEPTACLTCPAKNSLPNINLRQLPAYFAYADTQAVFSKESFAELAKWQV